MVAIDRKWKGTLLEVCHLVFVKHPIYTFIRRNRVGNKSHPIWPKWTATCTTISGRLASWAVLEEESEVSQLKRRGKREKKDAARRKSREEIRCCHSTSGKCIYRINSNGQTTLSGLSVLRILPSVMFIMPHDGQLDLLLPSPVWRMRLIKSDKLIASTNCIEAIELSDDTTLSEMLTSNKMIALHTSCEGLVKASSSRFNIRHN